MLVDIVTFIAARHICFQGGALCAKANKLNWGGGMAGFGGGGVMLSLVTHADLVRIRRSTVG